MNKKIKVIDFYADWCNPCKVMAPIFEQVSEDLSSDNIEFQKVNVDEDSETANRYQVRSIPTFVFEVDGVVQNRRMGMTSADQFREIIEGLTQDSN
jgi:thioredoxin